MTNKKYILLSLATVLLLLSSCRMTSTTNLRSVSTSPDVVWLKMTLDDYEFLGDSEIEVEYHRYFGLIQYINTVNGEPVAASNRNIVRLQGQSPVRLNPAVLNRALYKVYQDYPEADFLMPVMTVQEVQQLFLGRKVKVKAKIKTYKIKK